MNWFKNFMRGRYGVDQLGMQLLVIYFIVLAIAALLQASWLRYVAYALLGYCFFRIFSKKTYRRSAENTRYLQMIYPYQQWLAKKKNRFQTRKVYKYFKCPNCKQELRVPKGKGAITITCPKCRTQFDKKS